MKVKYNLTPLLLLVLLPFLMANKKCIRATTWGEDPLFAKWEEDHVDLDAETFCYDCHDDITSPKVKPGNHNITWLRNHGGYAQQKFGFRKGNVCELCHQEAFCSACHQQQAPEQHTEFWKLRGHGAMVGLDRAQCMACHKSVDFCERCHAGTRPISHNAVWGGTVNAHCQNCHLPVTSREAQQCHVCHKATPSHPW